MTVFTFEDIGPELPLLPLAARRALDVAGLRLSLKAWQKLDLYARRVLVSQGAGEVDPEAVRRAVAGADPPATAMPPDDESRLGAAPPSLAGRVDWDALSPLQRFALAHLVKRDRGGRLDEALREFAGATGSTHLDERGEARMVDVGDKPITHRRALASAVVRMKPETARTLAAAPKGDVLAAARIAGIQAAKRTPELIPLCHGVALTRVALRFDVDAARGTVTIKAAADARDRTGVEMEAMVAASVAALTIYDMLKSVERGICIEEVVLLEKSGGRSGHYRRDPSEGAA